MVPSNGLKGVNIKEIPKGFNSKILGVVLSGGLSSRMGRDKGLITKTDARNISKTWVETTSNLFSELKIDNLISINKGQKTSYEKSCDRELIIDDNNIPGPLRGILSVHHKYPNSDLFVLAVDLPNLNVLLLKILLEQYQKKLNQFDFFVFKNNQRLEPLCAIYTSQGLRKITKQIKQINIEVSSNLKKSKLYSLTQLLNDNETCYVNLDQNYSKFLANQNYEIIS